MMEDKPAKELNEYSVATELPVCCQADSRYPGMFRVKRAKGKAFSSGGFGVAISDIGPRLVAEAEEGAHKAGNSGKRTKIITYDDKRGAPIETSADRDPNQSISSDKASETTTSIGEDPSTTMTKETPPAKVSHQYLFLEEMLFLYEQGLLECQAGDVRDEKKGEDSQNSMGSPEALTSSVLYAMLKTFHLPMASYLVFAHLRRQTFRVLRYTSKRLSLIRQMTEECRSNGNSNNNNPRVNKRNLVLQLRQDVLQAPSPAVIYLSPSDVDCYNHQNRRPPTFAYCVYNPDCNFSKTNPGLPDFLVAITLYGKPGALDFGVLMNLVAQANNIPVKLATVSDSGTVIMFGITDEGCQPLTRAAIPANHP